MEKEEQLRILRNTRSGKEDLRRALAAALGVPYEARTKEKEASLFTLCQREFTQQYRRAVGVDYAFTGRDGKALKEILTELGKMQGVGSDDETYYLFSTLISNLPEWYLKNAFTLPAISKNLNVIISKIKNGKEKAVTGSDEDLAARYLSKLQS